MGSPPPALTGGAACGTFLSVNTDVTSSPGLLRRLWRGWKRIGKKIGDFQARVLLTVFYFVIVAPFALIVRAAADPLAIKPRSARGWRARTGEATVSVTAARQQF